MKSLISYAVILLTFFFAGCGSSEPELIVYSGRTKFLVEPLVEQFRQETGIQAAVRYGKDAQLLAALMEEGAGSPADLYWANTAGALGSARSNGLLAKLPDSIRARPDAFVPSHGYWVPATVRFRVLAYNENRVDEEVLPASVLDLPELEQFKGRIGWTPTYASFQDFITAMRHIYGRDTTKAWLEAMQELNPRAYIGNTPMIRAMAAGAIDIALTNHYYVVRIKHDGEGEQESSVGGPDVPVEMYHFAPGDVGNLALVTGAGLLKTSDNRQAALRFLEFLHSEQAQTFAVQQVNEYPVIEEVPVPEYLLPVDKALQISPDFKLEQLRDLEATLALMREVGLM